MKRLTLTFDNGPHETGTPQILAALQARGLSAIFFMVGQRVTAPGGHALARSVRAAGHTIGNHTMTHGAPLGESDDGSHAVAEIQKAELALDALTETLLFRPNGRGTIGPHLLNGAAVEYLMARGYTVMTWNAVPRDWDMPSDSWVGRALRMIERHAWTVLVLHDHHVQAGTQLPRFLDEVLAAGVEVRTDAPPECLPIHRGRLQWPIEGVIANGTRGPVGSSTHGET